MGPTRVRLGFIDHFKESFYHSIKQINEIIKIAKMKYKSLYYIRVVNKNLRLYGRQQRMGATDTLLSASHSNQ